MPDRHRTQHLRPATQMINTRPDHLKSLLSEILNTEITSLKPIATGKFNTSYRLSASTGQEFVIRIAPAREVPMLFYERDMILQEPEIHQLVRTHTDLPVAKVAWFDGEGRLLDRPFIVYTALPGEPCYTRPAHDQAKIKHELGAYLRQLHDNVTGRRFGYVGPHKPMEPQDTWADAFRIMWSKLIDDVASIDMYSHREADLYKQMLDDHIKHFEKLTAASLLHMDIWTQNILTDGERITGIVDWDRCLWGDREIEFSVVEYCGLLDENFWAGYGCKPDRDQSFRIRWAFYMLYEHQKYIFIRHARNNQPHSARQYRDDCRRLLNEIYRSHFEIF